MSKNVISASIVAVVLLLWLGSGLFICDHAPAEHPAMSLQQKADPDAGNAEASKVRAEVVKSRARTRYLVLRGRTQSKRVVEVKAEIAGKVISRPVERGTRVEAGDMLCELAVDDR